MATSEADLFFPNQLTRLLLPRSEIIEKLLKVPIDLGDKLGRIILRDGAFCLYPIMVWKPCYESRSPYYPFYMITVGGRNIYVGYDGKIYPTLHEIGLGA